MDYTVIENYIDKFTAEGLPFAETDGGVPAALYALYRRTGNKKYLACVENYGKNLVGGDGAFSVGNIYAGRVLFDLYRETGDDKYRKAAEALYHGFLKLPRTEAGTFALNADSPSVALAEDLCKALAFYTRYGTEFNRGRNYYETVDQISAFYGYAYDVEKKLLHGVDFSKTAEWCDPETGLSKDCELAATGWFVAGLADIVANFDMSAPDLKAALITVFRRTVEGIERYTDGLMLLHCPDCKDEDGNYAELLGSALVAYAMLKGARLGYVEKRFAELGEKIFSDICDKRLVQTEEGVFELHGDKPETLNDARDVAALLTAYTEIKALRR